MALGPVLVARRAPCRPRGRSRRTRPTGSGCRRSAGSSGTGWPGRRGPAGPLPADRRQLLGGERLGHQDVVVDRHGHQPVAAQQRGEHVGGERRRGRRSRRPRSVRTLDRPPRRCVEPVTAECSWTSTPSSAATRASSAPAGPGARGRSRRGSNAPARKSGLSISARTAAAVEEVRLVAQPLDLVLLDGDGQGPGALALAVQAEVAHVGLEGVEVLRRRAGLEDVVLLGPAGPAVLLAVGEDWPRRSRRCDPTPPTRSSRPRAARRGRPGSRRLASTAVHRPQ